MIHALHHASHSLPRARRTYNPFRALISRADLLLLEADANLIRIFFLGFFVDLIPRSCFQDNFAPIDDAAATPTPVGFVLFTLLASTAVLAVALPPPSVEPETVSLLTLAAFPIPNLAADAMVLALSRFNAKTKLSVSARFFRSDDVIATRDVCGVCIVLPSCCANC